MRSKKPVFQTAPTIETNKTLITISNHHTRAPRLPAIPASDYVGYFTNVHDEQLIFIAKKNGPPKLFHGDDDWTAHAVGRPSEDQLATMRAVPMARAMGLLNGLVPDLVLDADEATWLRACWEASLYVRTGADREMLDVEAVTVTTPVKSSGFDTGVRLSKECAESLAQHTSSKAYRAAITTVYMMAGVEFGKSGRTTSEHLETFMDGLHDGLTSVGTHPPE